ncbi:hypothetical protein OROMI_012920 [Orobanche minor]
MGGGSKSRTKKKSKSKKKLTSSERQRIYDQIYRQVSEEEEARRLAQEALDKKKQQARKAKEAAEKARMLNSLWATAGALLDFHYGPLLVHKRQRFIENLQKLQTHPWTMKMIQLHQFNLCTCQHDMARSVNYENYTSLPTHSTWIDMKPLDASSSHPLNEVTKSTQNLSLEEKVAVREGGIGSTSAQLL